MPSGELRSSYRPQKRAFRDNQSPANQRSSFARSEIIHTFIHTFIHRVFHMTCGLVTEFPPVLRGTT